jgi:hypothetical protein
MRRVSTSARALPSTGSELLLQTITLFSFSHSCDIHYAGGSQLIARVALAAVARTTRRHSVALDQRLHELATRQL